MPLTPFQTSGTISYHAAAEQAALSVLIYKSKGDGVVAAVQAAAGDVQLIEKNDMDPDWDADSAATPVWVAFKHAGEIWLVIMGTYTLRQWVLNMTGVISISGLGNSLQEFHGSWARMAVSIWNTLQPKLQPFGPDPPINISGHSLGGAVAWDVAALIKQGFPDRTVRVMTFGSPRPMEGEYTGTKPNLSYHVQREKDIVTFVPGNVTLLNPPDWQQQSDKFVVGGQGAVLPPDTNAGEIQVADLTAASLLNHLISAYADALAARYALLPPRAVTAAALSAAGVTVPSPAFAGGLPGSVGAQTRGGAMAQYKITMTFGYHQWGWRESHYWVSEGGGIADALRAANTLCHYRRAFLHSSCVLEAVSANPADIFGRTSVVGAAEIVYAPGGPGQGAGADVQAPSCMFPWIAAYVRLYDAIPLYASNQFFRGLGTDLGCLNPSASNVPLGEKTGAAKSAFDDYLRYLTGSLPARLTAVSLPAGALGQIGGVGGAGGLVNLGALGGAGGAQSAGTAAGVAGAAGTFTATAASLVGGWCFKPRDKDGKILVPGKNTRAKPVAGVGKGGALQVEDIYKDPDSGRWWVSVTPPPTFVNGQRVHLSQFRSSGTQGLNGDARILSVVAPAGKTGTWYRLSSSQTEGPCAYEYFGEGVLWNIGTFLVPYASARYGRVVNRLTGATHFGTKGRKKRRKKCCK